MLTRSCKVITHIFLCHQAVQFGTSISWEVNRHTMRHTGHGCEALAGRLAEVSAVLLDMWLWEALYRFRIADSPRNGLH